MIEAADADAYEATLIKQAMEPLNLALPGIMTEAAERVEPGMKGIFGSEWGVYTKPYADSLLGAVHQIIDHHPIPGYTLLQRRDRVHLSHDSTELTVRFIKAFAFTDGLAPAGSNHARRVAYLQGRLRSRDEMEEFRLDGSAFSLRDDTIFIIWRKQQDRTFRFTAVKPIEEGSFPDSPRASLTFTLGIDSQEYDSLSFEPRHPNATILVPQKNLIESDMARKEQDYERTDKSR